MSTPGDRPARHFLADLGMEAESIGDSGGCVRIPVTPRVTAADGGVRAGVLATLVDVVGGTLAARELRPDWMATADLGRIMRMLMNGGALDGRRILKPETVDAMLALQWRHDGGANGDSSYGNSKGVFNAWGLGNQHFLDISGPVFGDRLIEGGGFTAVGHHGDAYGLYAAFVFDRATKNGMIMLIGGTGFDPDTDRGAYSAAPRFEERILTAIYRRAIQGKAD